MSTDSFSFDCKGCGNCCARPGGIVRVTPGEIIDLAAALEITVPAFHSLYIDRELPGDSWLLKDGQGPACIFLTPGMPARCRVYAVRPAACRTFPHWPELLAGGAALAAAAEYCPGLKIIPATP